MLHFLAPLRYISARLASRQYGGQYKRCKAVRKSEIDEVVVWACDGDEFTEEQTHVLITGTITAAVCDGRTTRLVTKCVVGIEAMGRAEGDA